MKIKSLLIGMLACTALVGCSNEELIEDPVNNPVNGKADAYLAVRILDANGSGSRASNNGGYEYSENEHAISTAHFYFYDEGGKYVTFATADLNPANNKNEGTTVEAVTNSVLVLKNLTSTNFPKYVVAVLNQPELYENMSMAELQEELSASATVGGTKYNNNYIMVNSTATKVGQGGKFFATEIENGKFLKEPKEASELTAANTVNIYVERLAAKVTTKSASTTFALGNDFNIDGEDNIQLKAKVLGWGLNATNKKSYIIKKVHNGFKVAEETRNDGTTKVAEWDYSSTDLYRSWWAQSPNYNGGAYPVSYASGDYVAAEEGGNAFENGLLTDNYSLDYNTYDGLSIGIGVSDYCAENTNTRTELTLPDENFHAKATEVLLKAQVVDKDDNAVDLFRYDNTLYTAKGYLERLFNKAEGINVYKLEGSEYKAISSEDVFDFTATGANFDNMLQNKGDGKVIVKEFTSLVTADATWYVKGNDGKFTQMAVDGTKTIEAQILEKVNAAFTSIFAKEADDKNTAYAHAYHYNDGMMYYNVAIEHYRTNAASKVYDANGAVDVVEGEYGVVRNHHYELNITNITKLGAAVHDATEEIVPDKDENVTYCVGATINILAWKVVKQDVEI